MAHRRRPLAAALAYLGLVLLPAVGVAGQSTARDGQRRFAAAPMRVWDTAEPPAAETTATGAAAAKLHSVPTFADSFTTGGQTYTYVMVGTNPRLSRRRTKVPVVVVPVRFVFSDGTGLDPGTTTAQLRRSPLFRRSSFTSGTTQYGDAVQRAEFWTYTQTTAYHVLLGHPRIAPTVIVDVPASEGSVVNGRLGGPVGLVTESFFADAVVPAVVNRLRLPPTKLIVFWSYDVALTPPAGESGVILGEHSAGTDRSQTRVWTWAWASWNTTDAVSDSETDVTALSHEIAEWYNDPFGGNTVPPWESADYPCNQTLEVGDPLVGTTFVQDGYHLQDEAFLSWFAHQSPSIGFDGRYSFLGTLTSPPSTCVPQ